jgi:hypothetical protein
MNGQQPWRLPLTSGAAQSNSSRIAVGAKWLKDTSSEPQVNHAEIACCPHLGRGIAYPTR